MLTYGNDEYKDDYEILYTFYNNDSTYTYLIRERHTNRLALLENGAICDKETFTREDFEECAQLVADYTKD